MVYNSVTFNTSVFFLYRYTAHPYIGQIGTGQMKVSVTALIYPTTLADFIFPLKPSFKLSFKPNFGLKPN